MENIRFVIENQFIYLKCTCIYQNKKEKLAKKHKIGITDPTEVWLIRPWLQLHRHWLNKYSSHQHLNNSPDLLADQDKDLNKYHCCFSFDTEKDDKRKKNRFLF